MRVDKQFIRVYDTIFSWVFKKNGLDGLIEFWKFIAPTMLSDLQAMVAKDGVKGAYKYWNQVLQEEGAKFKLKLSKDERFLTLEMTNCPAYKALNIPTCPEYCRHCAVMYPEVLKPFGLTYQWNRKGAGRCEIKVGYIEGA